MDIVLHRRLRKKRSGVVEPPQSTFGFEPGRCKVEVKKEPERETEPGYIFGNEVAMDAHTSMVALFSQRTMKPDCVNATLDLLPPSTQEYIRYFDR